MRPSPPSIRRVRQLYDESAGSYDRMIRLPERLLLGNGRAWAAGVARGRTLEVAIGTGRNLPHYGDQVELTGIDVSERMLELARRRAAELGRPLRLAVADAQALPFEDERFDTVVATLALCSVPDDRASARELARVLKPGGRLVLLEHVRSPLTPVRAVQRALDPVFLRLAADHLLREPEQRVAETGLHLELCSRSRLGLVLRLTAAKPSTSP